MAIAIGALLGIASGAAQYFGSAKKEQAAKAAAERMYAPQYKVRDEYFQNKNLTAQLATGGLPAATQDYLTTENERGLSSGISAIEQMGGSPNDISKIYGAYNRSVNQAAAQNAQVQLQNIQRFMEANKELAGQKNIAWSLNDDRVYQNKLKELKMQQQIAEQNKWNGIQTAIGSLSAYGTSMLNSQGRDKTPMPAGNGSYNVSQPVDTISVQQPIQPNLMQRSSPDVSVNNGQQPTDFSSWDADRNEWSQLYNQY